MATFVSSFKVESGIQLLARLSRKPSIENFYPLLFQSGPKQGEVIELFGKDKLISLITDIVCTALLPTSVNGVESGILIFNCSGHFNYNTLILCMRNKIVSRLSELQIYVNNEEIESLLEKALKNLFVMEMYDVTQFYTSIYNLENILIEHRNISMVVFDTITAFYWSEQSFKLVKMDSYLKKILYRIQKISKEHKITILYTRPEYFSSSKGDMENLEPCCENPTPERINYRIHVTYSANAISKANIRTSNTHLVQQFVMEEDQIRWI